MQIEPKKLRFQFQRQLLERMKTQKSNIHKIHIGVSHRHLSNIDCLMVSTACLVCFISTVNGHSKKEALEDGC
jgi:hypothetical protein